MTRFTTALIVEITAIAPRWGQASLWLEAGPLPGETVGTWLARDPRGGELLALVRIAGFLATSAARLPPLRAAG